MEKVVSLAKQKLLGTKKNFVQIANEKTIDVLKLEKKNTLYMRLMTMVVRNKLQRTNTAADKLIEKLF